MSYGKVRAFEQVYYRVQFAVPNRLHHGLLAEFAESHVEQAA